MIRLYVPRDAMALALGADAVACALAEEGDLRGLDIQIIRTGSRGMAWLEPLVEAETPNGRVAYGPVTPADAAALYDAGLPDGPHPLRQGLVHELPWMKRQQRLTFARVGVTEPLSIDDYIAHDGFTALRHAIPLDGAAIVDEITASGLRGRGGAAFPTGIKWTTARGISADEKHVVCNADEGDSGTFADRMLMEGDPFAIVEGMAIAGLAVGAETGWVYVRSEYPHAFRTLTRAVDIATTAGWLGDDIQGSGKRFRVHVRKGAGSYVCGEETALLESLEGRRGVVRARPPVPAVSGLFGKPTVVNNVVTFATVPPIIAHGAAAYRAHGVGRSRGTLPVQLAGNIRHGGLLEVPFGISLRELVEGLGGGTASGRPVRAVQVGGPLGSYLTAEALDTPLEYEELAAIGGSLGHGGIVVFDDTVDMARMARHAMQFCALESCGKCTPCRIGAVRGVEVIDRIIAGTNRARDVALLEDLCRVMTGASLCAMGGMTPNPVLSAVRKFPRDFGLDRSSAASAAATAHRPSGEATQEARPCSPAT